MNRMCDYGCGQKAKYQFKNGKWCCGKKPSCCSKIKEKIIKKQKYTKNNYNNIENLSILCDSGCGNISKYKFKNGRYCCSKNRKQCPQIRRAIDMSGSNNPMYRKKHSEESIKKMKRLKKGMFMPSGKDNPSFLTIKKLNEKYPLFSKIEEMRYNPDKLDEKEIQVHCKNHKCKNSKEKGGWFTPTRSQLYERKRSLEKQGVDNSYFYCSEECKDSCILYRLQSDPFREEIKLPHTQEEYNIWKQTVLEQDNYECQYCESQENLHCHHIVPVKENEMLALDPDNGIVLCQTCHYEIGHKTSTECSTGNLATKNCGRK